MHHLFIVLILRVLILGNLSDYLSWASSIKCDAFLSLWLRLWSAKPSLYRGSFLICIRSILFN
jgi:hypothetical protein